MSGRKPLDERGAIALIALFFAMFAVAMLYTLVGTAEAIFFRERMQDAADAAALSSAVVYARSMNFVVLVNIVMAALLAVLVAIKLVEGLCIIGMVIAAALAWPSFGTSLAAIPPLRAVQSGAQEAYDAMKEPIDQALKALNLLTDVLKEVVPFAAHAIVQADLDAHFKPPVDQGFASGPPLPIEDDSFPALCGRAGGFASDVATLPLEPIPVFNLLRDPLKDALTGLTSTLSGWFCGESGGSGGPPTVQHADDLVYPRTSATEHCTSDADADACLESERFEQRSAPHPHTGSCQEGQDCSLSGDYETRVSLAREQCSPTRSPAPKLYWYQTRTGHVTYSWKDGRWVRGEPHYDEPRAHPADIEHPEPNSGRPPCGPPELNPLIGTGYNLAVHPPDDPERFLPVCSGELAPGEPPGVHDPLTRQVDFTEVVNLLGCKTHTVVDVDIGDAEAAAGGDDRAAKRVDTNIELGDEAFQIRALVHGNFDAERSARVVRLALFRRAPPGDALGPLRDFGNYSLAQAEYFYDGTEKREEWLWNMNYRARLRRFRRPEGDSLLSFTAACGLSLGGSCPEALARAAAMSLVLQH